MNIENLRDPDVQKLIEELEKLQSNNSAITYEVYPMEDKEQSDTIDMITRVKNIEKSVEVVELMMRNIFGNNVLIDGKFIEIKIGE